MGDDDKPSWREPLPRTDGFAPIESYAAVGDGRTVALVADDGQVDWWPLPAMDSPPAFAALLDPDVGGHVALRPDEPFEVCRRYLDGTNVLETRWRTSSGEVRVLDALSVGQSGRLPWSELVRAVEGVSGDVALRWTVAPGTRFDTARAWTEPVDGATLLHLGDQHMAVLPFDGGDAEPSPHAVSGGFSTSPGSRHLLAVTSSDRAPVFLPPRDLVEQHLELTQRRWRSWSELVSYDGDWKDEVHRSAVALKLLLYSPTGAIAAAPTTSLPERVAGSKNWDYRYMWVRDASFTADALLALGLHEEVQAAVDWLLGTVRRTAPHLHVFYRLDGSVPDAEREVDARGYRDSRPVRSGNGAATQRQLGTFGDLFDTVWRFVEAGHVLDPPTGRMLADLADRCCDVWQTPDAGIWELHEERHYTVSKMGCWVALDRAAKLADAGQIATNHASRWTQERDEVERWVQEHCWSASARSYTFYAGTDELDAATLVHARTGFDRGERMRSTIDAVRRELAEGTLVYRYSGMQEEEGAFVACSFWLVSALAATGQVDEARELMAGAVALANDVGLLSEQVAPSRAMLGNFPQGLSHLALINAAVALEDAR